MTEASGYELLSQASAAENRGDLRLAEMLYRRALAESSADAATWQRLAGVLEAAGRIEDARAAMLQAITLEPGNAEFVYALGTLHQSGGDACAACASFERALALDPNHAAACLCLADVLMDTHDYDRALATYRHALTLRRPFPEAHHNLAAALLQLGQLDSAIDECRQALAERPVNARALNTLGAALAKAGRVDEAIAALERAVQYQPRYASAYHNLGNVLDQTGQIDKARRAYRAALAVNPALDEARYDLAALGEGAPPTGTPRAYLLRLFDTYSTSFDEHLVEQLDYHVPELLFNAVTKGEGATLDVIDLGCGTGLVGKAFRGVASRLTGVDVSPGMIREAQRRGVYDQLVLDDIGAYLNSRRERCDLVLAADVFIYVGELESVFAAVARLLRRGGQFAFSLEITEGAAYVLQRNRRYAHSQAYIQRLAEQFGLATALVHPVKLRRHETGDAEGVIFVLHSVQRFAGDAP
jgi:predicted TPR repeat methyltransferase